MIYGFEMTLWMRYFACIFLLFPVIFYRHVESSETPRIYGILLSLGDVSAKSLNMYAIRKPYISYQI
jgi:hypothetical protein